MNISSIGSGPAFKSVVVERASFPKSDINCDLRPYMKDGERKIDVDSIEDKKIKANAALYNANVSLYDDLRNELPKNSWHSGAAWIMEDYFMITTHSASKKLTDRIDRKISQILTKHGVKNKIVGDDFDKKPYPAYMFKNDK